MGNTLVIQPLPGIGDLIWHLPFIHAIAKQEGPVSLLIKPRSEAQALLQHDAHVKHILWLERNPGRHDGLLGFFRLYRELSVFNFNTVWILHPSKRYVWLARLAKIKEIRYLKKTVAQTLQHPIAEANFLLKMHGVMPESEPKLFVDKNLVLSTRQHFFLKHTPWIGIGIGTSEPYKQWGPIRFAEFMDLLLQHTPTATFFIFGGKTEKALGNQMVQYTRAICDRVVLFLDQPLQTVMALLQQCQVLISNDTGILNMSAALQVPVVGLFGASPVLNYSPYIHPVVPVEKKLGMDGISVQQVLQTTFKLLS